MSLDQGKGHRSKMCMSVSHWAPNFKCFDLGNVHLWYAGTSAEYLSQVCILVSLGLRIRRPTSNILDAHDCAAVVFLTTNYMFCFLYCGTLLMSVWTVTLLGVLEVFWFYANLIIFIDDNNNNNNWVKVCVSYSWLVCLWVKGNLVTSKQFCFTMFHEHCSCYGFQLAECVIVNIVKWLQSAFIFC